MLWVIDALRLETHVFTEPADAHYSRVTIHPAGERLLPSLVPGLPLSLAEIEIAEEP